MAQLSIEVPEIIARRLDALAQTSGKSVDELTLEALDSFAGSLAARRAIVKARRAAAKVAGTGYSLADLGWLDGYSGQTVDELLLFEGTDGVYTILSALAQAVRAKLETTGPLKITGVERTLLSVMALLLEVNNGGYDLVRIGCTELADITQQALDSLSLPKVTVAEIEAAMATESTSRDRALERCNIAFYSRTEVWGRLFLYVKEHQDAIRI
jgi:hypothetical protein